MWKLDCDDDAEPTTEVDGVLLDRYRLVGAPFGRGAMADVYDAVDITTGELVALKVLNDRVSHDSEIVARFVREGRALQKMTHPNLVRVKDHGITADGVPWLSMERLRGTTLDALLRRGRLPEARAIRLLSGIAKALATVHARGIVHRDIKPENVFIVDPGSLREEAKLLDFGVAHVTAEDLGPSSVRYTSARSLLGTVAFMAPEQLEDGAVEPTPTADVFSFAATLYEAMTGRLPFAGDTIEAQREARRRGAIVPLSDVNVSAATEDFLWRALAREPSRRPANGLALVRELLSLAERQLPRLLHPGSARVRET